MTEQRGSRDHAVERLHSAREERDRFAGRRHAARGSADELAASTELHAAEDRLAAREAWLAWIDRDY
jgi:hypothetical protein